MQEIHFSVTVDGNCDWHRQSGGQRSCAIVRHLFEPKERLFLIKFQIYQSQCFLELSLLSGRCSSCEACRDHRNTVNNEKETATLSIEVNRKIRAEYDQGFRNLSNAAQNLARQPAEELMNKGLQYRQNWLRTMTAHRQYQETLRARNEPPEEILKGPGMVWWIRKGKPSLEEYRAMGF